jgi:putative oxidoreductase
MVALFLIGRVLFGGYFLYNAYQHLKNSKNLAGYAQMKGVPQPRVAVIASGILLLLGGLSVLLGIEMVIGMWLLVAFMLPTTIIMHAFWKEKDPQARMHEQIAFGKNIAILGALFIMVAMAYIFF